MNSEHGFMTEVASKMRQFGFTRKEAVLIVRIERGIDSLEYLVEQAIVRIIEHYHIAQYFQDKRKVA